MSEVASAFTPSASAWVDQDHPNQNHAGTDKLRLDGSGSHEKQAFIFFGRPFPLGAKVLTGLLRVTLATAWTGQTITVRRITESWKERQLAWNNRPAASASHEATLAITGSAGEERELNIASLLADVADGSPFHGLRFSVSGSADRRIYSQDSPEAELRPEIVIEWRDLPDPPDHLSPGGGLAVSLEFPTFSWDGAERGTTADQEQAYSQIQTNASADFTSPDWDSDWIANTDTTIDSSTTDFPGVDDDESLYWRVRVRDDAGLESEWSDPTQFVRRSQGVLEITNPAVAPDNFVNETTPPLTHTLTGRTQESVSRWIYEVLDDSSLFEQWSTGRLNTDEGTVHPDPGVLQSGKSYVYKVRTWDTIDREETQDDPVYVEATREFTYVRDGEPDPFETLEAIADGAQVRVTGTRSAAPDFICLKIDGEEILDRIDPADVFVSGTTYEVIFSRAKPRVTHTYELEAVVNDAGVHKHSADNPTDEATTRPRGIWLIDEDDGLALNVEGDDAGSFEIRESATTFTLPGSRVPVRIVDSIGGYAGTSSGSLPSKDASDDFLTLKGRGGELRLVLSHLNIPVRMEEGAPSPTPVPGEHHYEVSFGWFQSGEVDATFRLTGS